MRLHGIPTSIIFYHGPIFLSHFWKEIFQLQGIALKRSTTYRPQNDGQSEVVNSCLEAHLSFFSSKRPRHWPKWLSWVEYWYNTAHHSALECSSFKALYGCDPPPLLRTMTGSTSVSTVEQQLLKQDAVLNDLHMQLLHAQQRMKKYANFKRREETFVIRDKVFLKLRPYRQKLLVSRAHQKLVARVYGPYTVL